MNPLHLPCGTGADAGCGGKEATTPAAALGRSSTKFTDECPGVRSDKAYAKPTVSLVNELDAPGLHGVSTSFDLP